ncbi:xaa-Pro aminopeptidase 3-like [Acipenser ruthenus]|uniref:xaa-Pro aminopeptidase 3-like n=1 Tax=Acipenser ruthenus TaxID=7906 RepID=UPI0027416CDE|nr:xaa-Pro aminopeptidase 3-like [Acipenser ruthenus]
MLVTRSAEKLLASNRLQACAVCLGRWLSVQAGGCRGKALPRRYLGQPSPFTHPHLLKTDEVTPKLTQTEFELRRHRLMGLVASQSAPSAPSPHAVVVLSHPTHIMSHDIPYPFHQNPDLLYLCGFTEPDSALLLVSGSPPPRHRSLLFVPPRDPRMELWDGPRSGTDGATALTGVQEAYPTAELGRVLQQLAEDGCTLWYDEAHVTHPKLHDEFLRPLLEGRGRSSTGLRVRSRGLCFTA